VFVICSGNAPAFPEVLISGGRPKISYNPTVPSGQWGISKKLLDAKTVRFCGKVFVIYNLTPSFGRGEVISKKLKKENT